MRSGGRAAQRAKVRDAAVRQHHVLLEDVIDRLAVDDRARAARVVGHHPADRGAAGGGEIRCESQSERSQVGVEIVEHDAGLDARPAFVGVDLEDAIQVLRRVEHQAGADRLAGLRRAAAARRDRRAVLRRQFHHARHVLGRAWHDHADRLDLVDAGVGRVQRARDAIESDLAVNGVVEGALQRHGHEGSYPPAKNGAGRFSEMAKRMRD